MSNGGTATRGFIDRIVFAFDFDRTLSEGTFEALLGRLGVEDAQQWRKDQLMPLVEDGWDEILAKGWLMAKLAREQDLTITKSWLEDAGRSLDPYPGVLDILPALRARARDAAGGADIELHVVSSGFVDIICATPVADLLDGIWGSSMHFGEGDRFLAVKRTLIHSEKARYLLALAKGLDIAGANEPQDVHRDKPPGEWHVPLDQIVYVGDGASDLDAFNLLHDNGGIAVAVNASEHGEPWQAGEHMFDAARVENLAPPDFREGREMHQSLMLAAEIIGKKVALRRLGEGE
ncbi:hypothetical protein ACFQPG_11595 [Sphingomonas sp. GCM10030256]|uniref:hypothetical protein n=1 Tax=Sphingomonas sp. GCM10030256 TaxID=3273427 RepID=UPI003619B886